MTRNAHTMFIPRGISAAILFLSLYTTPSSAADHRFSIETDPATFAFSGYAAHLRISPASSPHWRFGAGAYAMDLPSPIVDINAKNRDKGWNVRIEGGYGLFSEYFPDNGNRGWLLGAQASIQDFSLRNKYVNTQKSTYRNLLIMPYGGYRWLFTNGLYLQPWLGVGYTQRIAGDSSLDGRQYDVAPVMAFATLHVGYEF